MFGNLFPSNAEDYDMYWNFFSKIQEVLLTKRGMRLPIADIHLITSGWGMESRVSNVYTNNYEACADHIYIYWYLTYMKDDLISFKGKI